MMLSILSCTYLPLIYLLLLFFKKDFIYFWSSGKGGRKRGRETSMCGCLLCAPYWGPGWHPRHVLWLGIKQATLWCGGAPSHRAPLAAADENIICLGRKGWPVSQRRKVFSPSLNGLLLSLACIGMHIKERSYGLQITFLGSQGSFWVRVW